MKILIVSASDLDGGASRCAYRLHNGLIDTGVDSHMLVWNKKSHHYAVHGPNKKQKAINFLQKYSEKKLLSLYKNKIPYANFSPGLISHQLISRINKIKPDIVNLHWICGASVSLGALGKIRQPIVWSLHDMWPFTGGCHYDYDCQKYTTGCEACPVLGSHKSYDLSKYIFNKKLKTYKRKKDIFLVPSSNWLGEKAAHSVLLQGHPMNVIHTGLNLNIFKPIQQRLARNILNLPQNRKLVLFGSLHGTADERKGFSFVPKTINLLKNHNIDLVLLGDFNPSDTRDLVHIPVHLKGVLHDEETLALLYSAADVILLPSIQENLANICLESLACGTPVVAFDIGGNSDMISHKNNGYLAQPFDAHDMAHGIEWVLECDERWEYISHEARKTAEQKFDAKIIAYQYQQLFNKIYDSSFSLEEDSEGNYNQQNTSNISVSTPSCG